MIPVAGRVVYGMAALGLLTHAAVLPFKAADPEHTVQASVFGGVMAALFIVAGVVAFRRRPENRVGVLMVLVGVGAVAEDIQFARLPALHTLGLVLASASTAFVCHLVLAFPTGRLESRVQRWLVGTTYAIIFGAVPASVPFHIPDPRNPGNLLLIHPSRTIVEVSDALTYWVGATVAVGVIVVLVRRWVTASAPRRRILLPVFATGLLGAAASIAGVVAGDGTLTQNVFLPIYRITFCLLPLGFLAGVLRVRLARTPLAELMIDLQRPMSSIDLQRRLATLLGDPSLRVGYWRPDKADLVTAGGRIMPPPLAGQVLTFVEHDGRRVAGLVHDEAVSEEAPMLRAAVAAAGLMLDNQRLTAEVRAQFEEISASRARIVAAGARERRRMERDLHDGVQQSLVAAAIGIRMVERRLDPGAAPHLRELVKVCGDGLETALADLRELARGLHPAVLADAGLVAALEAVVERAPVPVELHATEVGRYPPLIEETAYLVDTEALTNAMKHAAASTIDILVRASENRLFVEVRDDGVGGADPAGSGLLGLADRVRAVGGTLTVRSGPSQGTTVSAELIMPVLSPSSLPGQP